MVSAKHFLEQIDEARPGPFGGELMVEHPVDPDLVRLGVGEAVADMAVGVDLPIRAALGQLLAERDDLLRRDHRVVPAVVGDDLPNDLLLWQPGRVEQPVEADRGGDVGPASGEVERAHPAEAITRNHDPAAFDLVQTSRDAKHVLKPAQERGAILFDAVHLAEQRVARRTPEVLAEYVRQESTVAELDKLAAPADFEVGDAHHARDQEDRRPRFAIAPADEQALQLFAFELMPDRAFLAHSNSLTSCASLATVFMLRAVPFLAAGIRSLDRPMPL